ncbi:MAG: DNA repair protein RadC [Armatimonadetes bacterium]|nr:DNA repair protein RadC [Armatimonadota bacterium]
MDLERTTAWERVQYAGFGGATVTDLLTLMVTREERDLERNEPVVLQYFRYHTMPRLKDLSHEELSSAGGLEPFESARILAAIELGRRSAAAGMGERRSAVTRHEEAYRLFAHLSGQEKEHFCAAFFDSKGKPIGQKVIHIGTLNMSVVGAREVFREAVRHNASSVIVAHNHPSGDPEPSPEDVRVTKALKEAGALLDIPLHDHLVIGYPTEEGDPAERYVSLSDRGLL